MGPSTGCNSIPRVQRVLEQISSYLAEILVLAGGAFLSAPAVPASTRISARLKRVQAHSSPVSLALGFLLGSYRGALRLTWYVQDAPGCAARVCRVLPAP